MPIDRRITNGLAWAGALLVVAIPAADVAMRQFGSSDAEQVALVIPQEDAPAAQSPTTGLPTPAAQRPAPAPAAVADKPAAAAPVVASTAPAQPATSTPVVTTASSGKAVNEFLQSGRQLPSYITEGASSAPTQTAATPVPSATKPAAPATTTATVPQQVASVPQARVVGFPTPVGLRPAPLAQAPVVAQPPLIIDTDSAVVTAEDLADWESGPLSEFLAKRQTRSTTVSSDYDPDGFFLDEGPNSSVSVQRFPNAYDYRYYPYN